MKDHQDDGGSEASLTSMKKYWVSWSSSLWRGESLEDLSNVYQHRQGRCKEHGSRLFPCPVTGHRGYEHTLKHRKFLLSIRKHFVPCKGDWEQRGRLPREVVASSFMEICKSHLDEILLELGGCTRWHSEMPAHLSLSLTVWFHKLFTTRSSEQMTSSAQWCALDSTAKCCSVTPDPLHRSLYLSFQRIAWRHWPLKTGKSEKHFCFFHTACIICSCKFKQEWLGL